MDIRAQHIIYLYEGNAKAAEIVIDIKDGIYNICHTFVDDAYRGQGLAGKLMELALEFIESEGGLVKADCSYAQHYLEKHPQA